MRLIKRGHVILIALLITACIGLIVAVRQYYQQSIEEYAVFKPYTSTFHLLFDDTLHNLLLGNLTGEIKLTKVNHGIIQAKCELFFLGHESIDRIELITSFMPFTFHEGPEPIPIPAPPIKKIILRHNERITITEGSYNISRFKEPMVIFGFSRGSHICAPEGNFTLPTIRLYFSDGRIWIWEYKHDMPPFTFWSGIRDWKLFELSGKSEKSSYILVVI